MHTHAPRLPQYLLKVVSTPTPTPQYFLKVVPTRYANLANQSLATNQYSVTDHFM